jgi:putative addiction module killer protein
VKNTLNRTEIFATWLRGIRDIMAKARVFARLDAAREGNFGDWRSVGDGIFEMRVDVGVGYRMYYAREDTFVYLLLAGGDKLISRRPRSCGARFRRNKNDYRKNQ